MGDSGLTILGGKGFVGGHYVRTFYDAAIGNIRSVNNRFDYAAHSKDILYLISTVDNQSVRTDPHKDIDTNLTLLIKVLENWRQRPDSKDGVFNFISSWFVYGNKGDLINVSENHRCDPYGFYSTTKRCAEQLLENYCNEYGLHYRILRLANVMGAGDPKVSYKKNVLQYLVNRLAKNDSIQVFGTGDMLRDYIHVSDCVSAIDTVMRFGDINSVYNIGNGPTWNLRTILEYCRARLNSSSPIIYGKLPELKFYMNNSKIVKLGYAPKYVYGQLFDRVCEVASDATDIACDC